MLADTLIAFDHVKHRMLVIANAHIDGDVDKAYDEATARINQLIARLRQPLYPPMRGEVANGFQLTSNMTPERYCEMVRARKNTLRREIFFRWCSHSGLSARRTRKHLKFIARCGV